MGYFKALGPLGTVRWVTGAARLLCHLTRCKSPSKNLLRLAFVSLNFYLPGWFMFRKRPLIQDGSRNFFYLLELLRDLYPDDQKIAQEVLSFNAYWAHPESIVISMINDEKEAIRSQVMRILLFNSAVQYSTVQYSTDLCTMTYLFIVALLHSKLLAGGVMCHGSCGPGLSSTRTTTRQLFNCQR